MDIRWIIFSYFIVCMGSIHCDLEQHFKPVIHKTNHSKMSQIDYIYMINLDRRPEKYLHSVDQLKPYNIDPYRFSAVNGVDLSFETLDDVGIKFTSEMEDGPLAQVFRHIDGREFKSYEIMKEPGVTYFWFGLSRGAIGCFLSHLSVLQDAYDSGYKVIWILEDDIRVVTNPHILSEFVKVLKKIAPKWDVLFTDNEFKDKNNKPLLCTDIRPRPNVELKPLSFYEKKTPLNPSITKIGKRYGSHSMIISRAGIKKILSYSKTYKIFYPYDIEYQLIPDINLYTTNMDVVTNIGGWISDIQ
jgi:GR25 family glycosyltransferase involved in LPS biosynthesis